MQTKLTLILLLTIYLSACTRNGNLSEEGIYETLRSFNKMHNPTLDETNEDLNYGEYEALRKLNRESNSEQ